MLAQAQPKCSPTIVRYEIPPSTDSEWIEALKLYGRDRESRPSEFSALLLGPDSSHEASGSDTCMRRAAGPSRLLVHSEHLGSPNQRLGVPADGASDGDQEAPPPMATPWGSAVDSSIRDQIADEEFSTSNYSWTLGMPRARTSSVGDEDSAEAERQRLREHYETKGYLCSSRPSRATRMHRNRSIRRLGLLTGEKEEAERRAVIAKYAELAQQIFQVSTATVSIFQEDAHHFYGPDPEVPFHSIPLNDMACSHVVAQSEESCFVVADLSLDWRFTNNPMRNEFKYKFYAGAPLRYRRPGFPPVDLGTLALLDFNPRDTFDMRERMILLNLANMLVFQLATLQSEIMAKRSTAMHDATISFLRRSIIPDHLKPSIKKEKEREKKHAKSPMAGIINRIETHSSSSKDKDGEKVKNAPGGSGDDFFDSSRKDRDVKMKQPPASRPVKRPALHATKTGPKDTKNAKIQEMFAEKQIFTDAAATLRQILQADAVAMIDTHEFQLFIRKSEAHSDGKRETNTKETIVSDFLQGKPWPSNIEPVVNYVRKGASPGVAILGSDAIPGSEFHFDQPEVPDTMAQFIKTYLMTRHFWWDREETDGLAPKIVQLMPNSSQTVLAVLFMGFDGTVKYATFASWNTPPSAFGDDNRMALPFVWILGSTLLASIAIRKIRTIEQSQISYSNLQAHELRTPLHQILAITQLLRSAMSDLADQPASLADSSLTTVQQIRDLLPFLDAIDTSGKTLHGIVDNILSFLDLKAKDGNAHSENPGIISSPSGAPQTFEVMFEELIHEACEEDKRSRRANGQPASRIESIFEIIPPLLGEQVTEDAGGALRKALGKIISNAYKYIENEGWVEIYVDDVPSMLPPSGYEDLSLQKWVSIKIVDNGRGMSADFVRNKLGEPWAKEDLYATGSGLSVHLAFRIIDIMGGRMEISSAPGEGCTVTIEVPVPKKSISLPTSPSNTENAAHLATNPDELEVGRKVTLFGFDTNEERPENGLSRLGACLERQYAKLGCSFVPLVEAELIIADGGIEEQVNAAGLYEDLKSGTEVVYLVGEEHEACPVAIKRAKEKGISVRRFRKPVTPSHLRESLYPGQSKAIRHADGDIPINAPESVDSQGNSTSNPDVPPAAVEKKTHFVDKALTRSTGAEIGDVSGGLGSVFGSGDGSGPVGLPTMLSWKPKGICVEEAVASLCLGDYFSSRRRLTRPIYSALQRTISNGSSARESDPASGGYVSYEATPARSDDTLITEASERFEDQNYHDHFRHYHRVSSSGSGSTPNGVFDELEDDEDKKEDATPETIKVLVVEDNMINRKILVKILSSKLAIEVLEAEDGQAAVDIFKEFTNPAIVLLDINMPRMDGYTAASEMRAIERSRVSALTTLTDSMASALPTPSSVSGESDILSVASASTGEPGSSSLSAPQQPFSTRPSKIIAVTALGSESEKRRGLVECGIDDWLVKPCAKATITKVVEEARLDLLTPHRVGTRDQ